MDRKKVSKRDTANFIIITYALEGSFVRDYPEPIKTLTNFIIWESRKTGIKKGAIHLDNKVLSWEIIGETQRLHFSVKKLGVLQRLAFFFLK